MNPVQPLKSGLPLPSRTRRWLCLLRLLVLAKSVKRSKKSSKNRERKLLWTRPSLPSAVSTLERTTIPEHSLLSFGGPTLPSATADMDILQQAAKIKGAQMAKEREKYETYPQCLREAPFPAVACYRLAPTAKELANDRAAFCGTILDRELRIRRREGRDSGLAAWPIALTSLER